MKLNKKIINSNNDFFFTSSNKTKFYNKNENIYKLNNEISELFIILDGKVESYLEKDIKNSIKILEKGSVLGLMDIILNRKYSKNMKAKSKVSLAVIDKLKVEQKLLANPFQFSLIKSLAIDVDKDKPNIWS